MLGLVLAACDDPLKTVELIEEPRVLGARVEVQDEPERAAPAPGETATVRFLLASPALEQTVGFALLACPATPSRGTRAECDGEPFAQVRSDDGEQDVPELTFKVPASLDAARRVAILGTICPFGSPNEAGTDCDGAEPGTRVTLELELAREDDVNLNPSIAPELSFDDAAWPELAAVEGDCAGLGYVEVAAGSKHWFEVALDEGDRDPLPQSEALDPARESLQLSHFVTAGDLSRAFQSIAWDSQELSRRPGWTAPKQPGLARFWLVLRDFRGGSDFLERAVCVLPD